MMWSSTSLLQGRKEARTTQEQAQEEEKVYAYVDHIEISDDQTEEIPLQENRHEEKVPTTPHTLQPPTSTFEESLVYQFKIMNTRFHAMEERIVHFRSRLSNMETTISHI